MKCHDCGSPKEHTCAQGIVGPFKICGCGGEGGEKEVRTSFLLLLLLNDNNRQFTIVAGGEDGNSSGDDDEYQWW